MKIGSTGQRGLPSSRTSRSALSIIRLVGSVPGLCALRDPDPGPHPPAPPRPLPPTRPCHQIAFLEFVSYPPTVILRPHFRTVASGVSSLFLRCAHAVICDIDKVIVRKGNMPWWPTLAESRKAQGFLCAISG